MINFNFLGLGSFANAQQKGKTNGVNTVDSDGSTVLLKGDLPLGDAAFPDVLMQLLLGQQVPITLPNKPDPLPVSEGAIIGGGMIVLDQSEPINNQSETLEGQTVTIRHQLIAGEMKKHSMIQKTEQNKPISNGSKITLDQSENIEISKILLEGSESESETPEQQKQNENTTTIQLMADANTAVEGMSITNSPKQSNLSQLNSSTSKEENTKSSSATEKRTSSTIAQPAIQSYENVSISLNDVQKESKQKSNEAKSEKQDTSTIASPKSNLPLNDQFLNGNEKKSDEKKISVPYEKQTVQSKEYETDKIADDVLIKKGAIPVGEKLDNKVTPNAVQEVSINNHKDLRSVNTSSKKLNNLSLGKEHDIISISSNDVQQKGILSSVIAQNGKSEKNYIQESTVIDKSNSSEKQSTASVTGGVDKAANIPHNETQNSGNRSSMQKENFEHQPSSEKSTNPVEVHPGQQTFSSVIEERNSITVPKAQQVEVSSLLRQQDTVNNIFEQLAKNVKVSIDDNNSQIKISLKPEALGEVMLKVTVEQGKVSTQMEVQQPQVKTIIEANLQVLRDSLSSKGLVVDRIDISTAQYSLNEKSSQQGQQRQSSKNYFGKEFAEEEIEQTKLYGYNTVDYIA